VLARLNCRTAALAAALLASSTAASAQIDPASVERTIPHFETKGPTRTAPVIAPPLPAQVSARIAGTFVLGAVNVQGATAFSSEELAKSFEPFLASRVGQAELNTIVASITDRYRRAGYLLSYAVLPEQSVASGIVTIRVVEGFVSRVQVEGDPLFAPAVRSIAERLRGDRPLRTSTLERVLSLIRETPGVTVKDASLRRSPADPGDNVLTIVISADRVRGVAFSDNRGTVPGARLRGYSSISAASLFVSGDETGVDLFAIPGGGFRYFYGQVKTSLPLGSNGLRFTASASRGDQRQQVAAVVQHGDARQFTGELAYPLAKSRALELSMHGSLTDWLSRERRPGQFVQRDRIDVARAWLQISRLSRSRLDARVGIAQGLDLGSATGSGDPLATRPFGTGKFTKINADVQINAPVAERLVLRLDSSAQWSTRSLLASEEFALGGARIGRAYDFNAVTGDSGFAGMAELSYRLGDLKGGPRNLNLFAYTDAGAAFRMHASPGLPDEQWLASVGAGTRFTLAGMTLSGELGVPLHRINAGRQVRAFVSIARTL
jgi:hemolysin activation/secretion protein